MPGCEKAKEHRNRQRLGGRVGMGEDSEATRVGESQNDWRRVPSLSEVTVTRGVTEATEIMIVWGTGDLEW